MASLPLPLAVTLVLLVLLAAASDLKTRRIPNALSVAGVLAGVALQTGLAGWTGLERSLLGFVLGLLIFLPLFLLRGMGGGDVKLMAAVGATAGPGNTFVIFILTAVIGGVLGLALLMWKGGLRKALRNCGVILWDLVHLRAPYQRNPELSLDYGDAPKLPYTVPIALGTLVFLAIVMVP